MANKAKAKSNADGITFLREAFSHEQAMLQSKINAAHATVTHDGTMGAVFESNWISEFLERYLPARYTVGSGIVIDSLGKTSDQIDIVIYDNQYTPTLLSQGSHKFIPAESVYAVLEVKPQIDKKNIIYASNKVASVRRLTRTSVPIRAADAVYPAKKLHNIVGGIVAAKCESIEKLIPHLQSLSSDPGLILDCGCALDGGAFDVFNHDKVFSHEGPIRPEDFQSKFLLRNANNVLVYFMFRLLGRLQSIGTVPAVDWTKYGEVFNEAGK